MKTTLKALYVIALFPLALTGCSSTELEPQIQKSCVPPTVTAQVLEDGTLLLNGIAFVFGCGDVIENGTPKESTTPMGATEIKLKQGEITETIGIIDVNDQYGDWSLGAKIPSVFGPGDATVTVDYAQDVVVTLP